MRYALCMDVGVLWARPLARRASSNLRFWARALPLYLLTLLTGCSVNVYVRALPQLLGASLALDAAIGFMPK